MTQDRRIRWLFVVLFPCLFLQLPLREITEPYPAILLPAGAAVFHSTGDYTAYETELMAVDADGNSYPVAAPALLDAVPSNYHKHVIARGFGMNAGRDVRRVLRAQFGRPLTPQQIAQTREWVRSKLRSLSGIDAVHIDVLTFAVTATYQASFPQERRALEHTTGVDLLGGGK